MNKEIKLGIIAALQGKPSANFSAEDVNAAAINAIMKECGLDENSTAREIRMAEDKAFALIEEAVDEILPRKLESVLGEFAEVRSFPRDAEVLFNIEKIGKARAKLTISKGARGGIYRAARLDSKFFSPTVGVQTVAVYVTLEELILGTASLSELYANILEGFEEIVYKEVFNALATGAAVSGYGRIVDNATSGSANHNYDVNRNLLTTKATLGEALDMVMPYVKQYGVPTIFGSYAALVNLYNPLANTTYAAGYPNGEDSKDIRAYGFIQVYKGVKVVELPNYLVDSNNDQWFYDTQYVFVLPSGVKPVKVALKGELFLKRNEQATGSEKWEAHKIMGVGLAMANNFAVIKVTDL
jgi:hypothetical protein